MRCLGCLTDSEATLAKEDIANPTSIPPSRPGRHTLPPGITSSASRPPFVESIREWLGACDKRHTCVTSPLSGADCRPPTWVIDTRDRCIVSGAKAGRYLALSYRWQDHAEDEPEATSPAKATYSHHEPLQLDKSLLSRFRTRGALSSQEIASQLPKVILDAMELTTSSGERYLWIDRLCVVQHEPETMAEVARMDQIYAGAYLVIVAAAPHGLYEKAADSLSSPEFRTGFYRESAATSDPPEYQQDEVDKLGGRDEYYRFQVMQFYWQLRESEWATRGWTYQEHVLCRRAVFFLGHRIVWECRCAIWDTGSLAIRHWLDENGACPSNTAVTSSPALRLSTQRWPDFSLWTDLVCPFNAREFTFQNDALIAVSGILNSMARVFPGGFVGGMPALFLDHALLWQPLRRAKRRSNPPTGLRFSLPSWSWCGWQCPVSPWSLCSGVAYIDNDKNQELASSWRTRNLITWRAVRQRGKKEEEIPIKEPLCLEKLVAAAEVDPSASISDGCGWRRDTKTTYNVAAEDELTEVWLSPTYTLDSDKTATFKHPIPLRQPDPPSSKTSLHPYGNDSFHLKCDKVQHAFLRPAALLRATDLYPPYSLMALTISATEHPILTQMPPIDQINPVLVLEDSRRRFSGVLRLMSLDDNDDADGELSVTEEKIRVNEISDKSLRPGNQLELIAISTGSARRAEIEECFEERALRRNTVEWKDEFNSVMFDMVRIDPNFEISPSFSYRKSVEQIGVLKNEWEGETRAKPGSLWGSEGEEEKGKICHFYNVLWIERKDGVAYRRACGRIPKDVWERNTVGDISVLLG